MAEPMPGGVHRGRLVGYGQDSEGNQYAVLDTGRELRAIPPPDGAEIGHDVRARAMLAAEEEREQRPVRWSPFVVWSNQRESETDGCLDTD